MPSPRPGLTWPSSRPRQRPSWLPPTCPFRTRPTYAAEDGSLDVTAYVEALEVELQNLSLVLSSTEIDQIAAAYPLLSISRAPVGSGPFYVTEFRPGQDITAKRNDLYHWGPACLRHALHAHHQGRCGSFVRAGRW